MDCYYEDSQKNLHVLLNKEGVNLITDGENLGKGRLSSFYTLIDGRIIIVTAQNIEGAMGLVFQDKACFEAFQNKGTFPVENPEKIFWENAQATLLSHDNPFEYYSTYIKKKFPLDVTSPTKESFKNLYDAIQNSRKTETYNSEDVVALFVVGGEIYRKAKKGRWTLIQEEGVYNPFFSLVVLLDNDEYVDLSFSILNHFQNDLNFNDIYFQSILNTPSYGANLSELTERNLEYIIK